MSYSFGPMSEEEITAMLAEGDIPRSLRETAPRVVVILTQQWCPQWKEMARWLPEFADRAHLRFVAYDLHPRFETIMTFKEDTFDNRYIPYLRVYWQGALVGEGNWMPRRTFETLFERTAAVKSPPARQ